MNAAPSDDLDMADYEVDAAMVQTEIAARAACGLDYKVILALGPDRADPAGATEVFANRHRPECSWQWSTVHPMGTWQAPLHTLAAALPPALSIL